MLSKSKFFLTLSLSLLLSNTIVTQAMLVNDDNELSVDYDDKMCTHFYF